MRHFAAAAVVLAAAAGASAQYQDNFEAPLYTGSAAGDDLVGQNGYYNPIPASSVSGKVHTYAGNPYGLPQNPNGGRQFVAAEGPGGGIFSRNQKDTPYTGVGIWTAAYDFAIAYTGVAPASQNLGSFSTQVFPGAATFIALATWTDPATATNWNADYIWFDAAGTQIQAQVPNPAFQNLALNHWYRWSTTWNMATNQILEVAITDLTTNVTTVQPIADRYLFGGAAGAPLPTGFRMFGGGGTAGNVTAWDNISIIPAPGTLALLGGALLLAGRRRRA